MAVNAVRSARGAQRARGRLPWVMAVGLLIFAGACGSAQRTGPNGSQPAGVATQPQVPTPGATPVACRQWACRAQQTVNLPGDRTVTLWRATDQLDYRSRPVVELRDRGASVQWWTSPQGDGWNGSLTCLASGTEPNCVLLDSLGMHAGVAEMLILRGGRLVHPTGTQVITNTSGMRAADLNGDGYLDVIATTNDYQPNYAQGHNFWQTFGYSDGRLVVTGCARRTTGAAAPTQLLTGSCPTV